MVVHPYDENARRLHLNRNRVLCGEFPILTGNRAVAVADVYRNTRHRYVDEILSQTV